MKFQFGLIAVVCLSINSHLLLAAASDNSQLQFNLNSNLNPNSKLEKMEECKECKSDDDVIIHFDPNLKSFHLRGRQSSYVMIIDPDGRLQHLYWGPRISVKDDLRYLMSESVSISFDPQSGMNSRMFEYPDYGSGDYRLPAFRLEFGDDGSSVTAFNYHSHEICHSHSTNNDQCRLYPDEQPHFRPLERTKSLIIHLVDSVKNIQMDLRYSVFPDHDSITRSVKFTNIAPLNSTSSIFLEQISSVLIDFPASSRDKPLYMTHLAGSWARERHVQTRPLVQGLQGIDSRRGASSHQHNPFVAISEGPMHESHGNVYAVGLVHASSFQIMVEKSQTGDARLTAGIHPDQFKWELVPGTSFTSPDSVLLFSAGGGSSLMTNNLHRLIRESVLPGSGRTRWGVDVPRPIMVNSWEAMYFLCTEDRIIEELARPAGQLGIEMVVVDDGWFGDRWTDRTSLGDWWVDKQKFPNGLGGLADRMRQVGDGIMLGIWMEPEMVSPESRLYKTHPEWALHVDGREKTLSRNQLVLDLSRQDVQDFIFESVSRVLRESKATYLKWDFNRHLSEIWSASEPPSRQGHVLYKWTLGLYRIWHKITMDHPHVLFESCSGGGGRFDLALLYFTPQVWTSDNTDAISRVPIQLGTSLFYPYVSMASHVSAIPNHQLHRTSSLVTRHFMAMSGTFGYELNLKKVIDGPEHEIQVIKQAIHLYKSFVQPLVYTGTYFRLNELTPTVDGASSLLADEPQTSAWIYVSQDQSRAAMFCILTSYHQLVIRAGRQKAKGLVEDAVYEVQVWGEKNFRLDLVAKFDHMSGSTLMHVGIVLRWTHDADSALILLRRK